MTPSRSRLLPLFAVTALLAGTLPTATVSADDSTQVYATTAATLGIPTTDDGQPRPYAQALVLHTFNKGVEGGQETDYVLGVAGFTQVVPYAGFAELLGGPTLTIDALTLGLMAGLENGTEDLPARGSAFMTLLAPTMDLTVVTEYGVSGFWHYVLARAGSAIGPGEIGGHAGLVSRRFFGEGIYVDAEISHALLYIMFVEGFEDRALADGEYVDYLRAEIGLTLKL